ncbi:MAG: hypothetical protein IPQ07_37035 [Myxococcales bacterium]|nr:hypothetical protein [Myxococcales bacterium]
MNRLLVLSTFSLATAAACGSDPSSMSPDATPGGSTIDEQWYASSSGISALAVDGEQLVFFEGAMLRTRSLTGGEPTTLATLTPPANPSSFADVEELRVGPTSVAFVEGVLDAATGAVTKTLFLVPRSGGAPVVLSTSQDSRAFLGLAFDGDALVFSSNTSVYRVALAGGTPQYVGQSEGSVLYWIFSPLVQGDQILWAADAHLYRLARTSSNKRGMAFATLPAESAQIIAVDRGLVVALSPEIDFQAPANAIVEVDPVTGAAGTPVSLGGDAQSRGPGGWRVRRGRPRGVRAATGSPRGGCGRLGASWRHAGSSPTECRP